MNNWSGQTVPVPRLPPAAGRKRHQTQPLVGTPTAAYSRLSGRKPHCGEKRPLPRVVRPVIYRYRTTEHHRALLPVVRGKACHQEKRTFIYSQITYYTRRLCTSIIEDEKRNFNRLKRLLEEIDGTFRIDR